RRSSDLREGGHELRAMLPDVASMDYRVDDGGVRARSPDPLLLQDTNQGRFRVPCGRLCFVTGGLDAFACRLIAFLQLGQGLIARLERRIRIIRALHIGPEESGKDDGPAGCTES